MASTLPAIVALKSMRDGRYICPVVGDEQAPLQLSGENIFSPYVKYKVEATQGGLVHIRCCYNNKYWSRRSEDDHRIAARATEPEGVDSMWSCTLFKPTTGVKTVRFLHVQLKGYVSVMPFSDDITISLEEPGAEFELEFEFVDWRSLLMLPKHVAFKGDRGRYLSARQMKDNCIQYITGKGGHNYMKFTGGDIGYQAVRNDVFVTADGYVRIKSHGHGKFWRLEPNSNWIWADSNGGDNDRTGNHLFRPVQMSDSSIAFRSNVNNLYCWRGTGYSCRKNCLRAAVDGMIGEPHLEVEETVISRIIHNVNFRPTDATVKVENDALCCSCVTNNTRRDSVEELTLSYTFTRRSKWSSNVSLMFGVKAAISVGLPSIPQLGLEISSGISRTIHWEEEEEVEIEITGKSVVTVSPMATMKTRVTATRGIYEVPFSYTQSDTLTNGEQVSYRKDDGVYFCDNYFNFQRSHKEEPIEAT